MFGNVYLYNPCVLSLGLLSCVKHRVHSYSVMTQVMTSQVMKIDNAECCYLIMLVHGAMRCMYSFINHLTRHKS